MYIWKESYTSGNDYNWPDAPWNEHERECEECGGIGEWYEDDEGDRVTLEEYRTLPQEKKDNFQYCYCSECGGDGIITY